MNDTERVRRLVDGELDAAREAALMAEAARRPELARAIEQARALGRQIALLANERTLPPPADLVERSVRRAIRVRAEHEARPRGLWYWLERPVTLRTGSLIVAGAMIAAVAVIALRMLPRADERGSSASTSASAALPPAPATREAGVVAEPTTAPVRFVLPAKGAASVTVAGDFNGWLAGASPLRDDDGDGVFVGMLRLPRGTYAYMFVVDGQRWISDPYATNFREDDFGNRNAVLRID